MEAKPIYSRKGSETSCPVCNKKILYTWLSGMSGPHLYFYAENGKDVLVRKDWFYEIDSAMENGASDASIEEAVGILLRSIPDQSKGYALWNNVKCPRCKYEFPYAFHRNLSLRLTDFKVILIDGCEVDFDKGKYIVEVLH
jgi:DNA-directed RNA polymerase subunit RPC12/RpoP